MLNYIWVFMIIISFICALISGRMSELSSAVINGAEEGVQIVFSLAGMMAFWSGMMRLSEKSGLAQRLSKILYPILHLLFRGFSKESEQMEAISMNVTANILGIGNAATPFGLKAMQLMNSGSEKASNEMIMFVLINTASLQLIPTTVGMLREKFGSQNPFEIIPAVWLVSLLTIVFVVLCAKFMEKLYG